MPTRFCLLRHGETDWNVDGRLQGQFDVPLNDRGRAQAEAAARRLAEFPFSRIVSSDLSRAAQTAAAAGRALGLPVETTPRLRERFFGDFQGLTHEEARARAPQAHASFRERDPDARPPGGGESFAEFFARVRGTLVDLARENAGGSVLIVAHGGVLDMARRFAAGLSLRAARDYALPNAALNWIETDAGGWRVTGWGDVVHLGEALDEIVDQRRRAR